jgi:hypothetical protein
MYSFAKNFADHIFLHKKRGKKNVKKLEVELAKLKPSRGAPSRRRLSAGPGSKHCRPSRSQPLPHEQTVLRFSLGIILES